MTETTTQIKNCRTCGATVYDGENRCPMCGAIAGTSSPKTEPKYEAKEEPPKVTPAEAVPRKICKYCSMSIPATAKICPHCRKQQGISLTGKIIAGFFMLMVGSCLFHQTTTPPSQSKESEFVTAKNVQLQPERNIFIKEMILKYGILTRTEDTSNMYCTAVVTSNFYLLDHDKKERFISVIYAYYATERKKINNEIYAVILEDNKTGNQVGRFMNGSLEMEK